MGSVPHVRTTLAPKQHTQTNTRKAGALSGCTMGGTYDFLKGVDKVLQVNVISVGPNVALKELPEAVPHPVLEQEGQHSHSQLQEEDEHDGTAELQGNEDGSGSHHTSSPWPDAQPCLTQDPHWSSRNPHH